MRRRDDGPARHRSSVTEDPGLRSSLLAHGDRSCFALRALAVPVLRLARLACWTGASAVERAIPRARATLNTGFTRRTVRIVRAAASAARCAEVDGGYHNHASNYLVHTARSAYRRRPLVPMVMPVVGLPPDFSRIDKRTHGRGQLQPADPQVAGTSRFTVALRGRRRVRVSRANVQAMPQRVRSLAVCLVIDDPRRPTTSSRP